MTLVGRSRIGSRPRRQASPKPTGSLVSDHTLSTIARCDPSEIRGGVEHPGLVVEFAADEIQVVWQRALPGHSPAAVREDADLNQPVHQQVATRHQNGCQIQSQVMGQRR